MRCGWIKYYTDGTFTDGNDYSVKHKLASWTKSRNIDIIKTEMDFNNKKLCIVGLGEYWQSDLMTATFKVGRVEGAYVSRRIMKLISSTDKFVEIHQTDTSLLARFLPSTQLPKADKFIVLEDRDINKWLILELDLVNSCSKFYFSDVKI